MAVFKKKGREPVKQDFYYEKDGAEKLQMTVGGAQGRVRVIVSKMPDKTVRVIYGTAKGVE